MKKLGYFLAVNTLLALVLSTATLQAVCPCRKPRPVPGSFPVEQEQKLYEDIAKQAATNKKFFGGPNAGAHPKLNRRDYYYSQNGAKFSTTSHFLTEKDPAGSMIGLQDGSGFTIKESQQEIARSWAFNVPLAVVPNSLTLWEKIRGAAPAHKYRLINLKNNQSVEATLALGPLMQNSNARQIVRLDAYNGEIYLNNGSCWKIDINGSCGEIFKSWKQNHFVILGNNDTWFSLGNQAIIIDVEADSWLPATRLY